MSLEFGAKVRRIPVYPAADGYASEGPVAKLASNESPYPPIPAVVEAVTQALGGLNRYPDPTNAALRTRLSDRYGVPANRIAVGNGSCDILLAAGDALLEPGAEVVYAWPSFSVYPHLAAASGARAIEVPLDDDHRHDLAKMREEITVATRLVDRLQPEQPDLDRAAARRDRRLRRRRPAPRRRDPRRGLLRVQHPPGPRRVDPAAQEAPEPRAAADVLEGLRALRPARRLRALRLGVVPHRRRPGAPAVLLQRRRAGRRARGAQPPGRGRPPRRAQPRRADRARGRAAPPRPASPPSRRPTSSGSTCPRPTTRPRPSASCSRASPSARSSCAAATRWAARARCASPSAPRRRTSASSRRSPRCSKSSPRNGRCWYNSVRSAPCLTAPHTPLVLMPPASPVPRVAATRTPPGDFSRRSAVKNRPRPVCRAPVVRRVSNGVSSRSNR